MNDMQQIAKARCGKGFVAAFDHAGKAVDGLIHGTLYLLIWGLASAANVLKLIDEHVADRPQQMTLDEVA